MSIGKDKVLNSYLNTNILFWLPTEFIALAKTKEQSVCDTSLTMYPHKIMPWSINKQGQIKCDCLLPSKGLQTLVNIPSLS